MIADLKPYPEYKESGLPSLGQVPGHWEVRQVRHIGRLLKGVGGTKEDAVPVGVPCVRYGELYTTYTYFIRTNKTCIKADRATDYTPIQYGDVLFAASGETIEEIGKSAVNLMRTTAVCGGDVIVLRPSIPVNAPFLGYALDCRPATNQKATMGRGTTVKHIYPDELRSLLFPLPNLDEQAAILRFLDWADARLERAIRAKRNVIALLNEQKQAIIHRAVTRGLDPSVPLTSSGIPWLGEIPVNYKRTKLGRVCISIRDGTHNPPTAIPGIHRLLSVRNVINGRFVVRADDRTMTPSAFAELQRSYRVEIGDVVVAIVGATTGKSAVVENMQNVTVQRSLAILRPDSRLISGIFLNLLISSEVIQRQIKQIMDKYAAQPGIYLNELSGLQVIYPFLNEQDSISACIYDATRPLDATIARLEREIALLREYRTRLVADVVTGKLDVREAAGRLPDAGVLDIAEDADASADPEAADEEAVV